MKTWAEATKGPEQRALLAWAESSGNIKAAAKALGISRRYLTRLISETRRTRETVGLTETGEASSDSGPTIAPETRTHEESLTYVVARPSLGVMGSAVASLSEGEALNLPNVPKDIKDWLEGEALRRKQAGLTRRPNMTLVIVDAVRALQERQKQGSE